VTVRLPRCDARDNRGRILDAARAVFAADGLDAPVRKIAQRAEVGPATVYRHFPTKLTLATEAFTEQQLAWRSVLDNGIADPDPWHGFCLAVTHMCELQAHDLGFTMAFKSTFPGALDFASLRADSLTTAAELIRRARETGRLRPDVGLTDLMLMITANAGVCASAPASRRFATLMIRAVSAPHSR
jgi:AcrR family transcriptional regulator